MSEEKEPQDSTNKFIAKLVKIAMGKEDYIIMGTAHMEETINTLEDEFKRGVYECLEVTPGGLITEMKLTLTTSPEWMTAVSIFMAQLSFLNLLTNNNTARMSAQLGSIIAGSMGGMGGQPPQGSGLVSPGGAPIGQPTMGDSGKTYGDR